jgi:hypothetical protein
MIDITTLRLGNILLYKDQPHYVSMLSLDIDDEYQELIGVTPLGQRSGERSDWIRAFGSNELKQATLTEEWLSKFGFGYRNENGQKYYHIYSERIGNEIHIGMDDNKEFGLLDYNADYFGTDTDFVHQLQNLYFALTGEELTIK